MSALEVSSIGAIATIARDEWDRLAPDPFASHGWLRTVEDTYRVPVTPRYFLVREGGRLVGAAPCFLTSPSPNIDSVDHRLFGRLLTVAHRLSFSWFPAFLCGPPAAAGQHLLIDPVLTAAKADAVRALLLDAVERDAASADVPVFFTNVLDDEESLLRLLGGRSYWSAPARALAYLDIDWTTPGGYEAMLRRRGRNSSTRVRKERNKNARAGVTIMRADTDELDDHLYQLIERQYRRLSGLSFAFDAGLLRALRTHLGAEATIYVAVRAGEPIAAALRLHRGDVGYMWQSGIDRSRSVEDATYFNIVYYRPIDDAASDGLRRLYFGAATYDAKAQRGCRARRVRDFYRAKTPLQRALARPTMAFLSVYHRERLPEGMLEEPRVR